MPDGRATHRERPEDVKSNSRYHEVSRSINLATLQRRVNPCGKRRGWLLIMDLPGRVGLNDILAASIRNCDPISSLSNLTLH